jgi:hypothetical protein
VATGDEIEVPINLLELDEHLKDEQGYEGSYTWVLRYVRERHPKPPAADVPAG